jgi:hypothetical protein
MSPQASPEAIIEADLNMSGFRLAAPSPALLEPTEEFGVVTRRQKEPPAGSSYAFPTNPFDQRTIGPTGPGVTRQRRLIDRLCIGAAGPPARRSGEQHSDMLRLPSNQTSSKLASTSTTVRRQRTWAITGLRSLQNNEGAE